MSDFTLEQTKRMRRYVGSLCEQHTLDCGICASSHVFMCDEMRRLLSIKFAWMKRVMELLP